MKVWYEVVFCFGGGFILGDKKLNYGVLKYDILCIYKNNWNEKIKVFYIIFILLLFNIKKNI